MTAIRTLLTLMLITLPLAFLTGCSSTGTTNLKAYSKQSAQKIYTDGERQLAQRDYAGAVKQFEAIDALYPFGPYAQKSQLQVIYAYYKTGDVGQALAAADRYIRLYPQSRDVDYAYYLKGMINMDRKRSSVQKWLSVDPSERDLTYERAAFASFATLVKYHPNSPYAADARRRMIVIRNTLAQNELNIGEYYYQRGAYLAAANRASYVVQHFEGAPQVEPALVMMVHSYRQVNKHDLANESLRLLRRNFPHATV